MKAYCLAYLEERQLESNIKKLWRKPFLKDLTPEEIKVVENLVSEKRLCLQLGREVGPELAVRYERSNQDNEVQALVPQKRVLIQCTVQCVGSKITSLAS